MAPIHRIARRRRLVRCTHDDRGRLRDRALRPLPQWCISGRDCTSGSARGWLPRPAHRRFFPLAQQCVEGAIAEPWQCTTVGQSGPGSMQLRIRRARGMHSQDPGMIRIYSGRCRLTQTASAVKRFVNALRQRRSCRTSPACRLSRLAWAVSCCCCCGGGGCLGCLLL